MQSEPLQREEREIMSGGAICSLYAVALLYSIYLQAETVFKLANKLGEFTCSPDDVSSRHLPKQSSKNTSQLFLLDHLVKIFPYHEPKFIPLQ